MFTTVSSSTSIRAHTIKEFSLLEYKHAAARDDASSISTKFIARSRFIVALTLVKKKETYKHHVDTFTASRKIIMLCEPDSDLDNIKSDESKVFAQRVARKIEKIIMLTPISCLPHNVLCRTTFKVALTNDLSSCHLDRDRTFEIKWPRSSDACCIFGKAHETLLSFICSGKFSRISFGSDLERFSAPTRIGVADYFVAYHAGAFIILETHRVQEPMSTYAQS